MIELRRACRWIFSSALAALVVLGSASSARANEYEAFINIQDEEDLYDLEVAGEIETDTLEILIDLVRRGIDLNVATREQLYVLPNLTYEDVDAILKYRDEAGRIGDPAALVIVGALSARKLRAIAPFLIVPNPDGSKVGVRGFVDYRTIWTAQDDRVPPMALRARVSTLRNLTLGAAGLVDRNRLAPASWDPNRRALISDGPRTRPRVPKYFAQWDTPKWGVIAGTFTIGFGQRLVLDTSGRYTPNGFFLDDSVYRTYYLTSQCRESTGELGDTPCPLDEPREYVTPDFSARERQRGAAFGVKHIELPKGWMQVYGFFSHQTRNVRSSGLYNKDLCDDPRFNDEFAPECGSISTFKRVGDPLAPVASFRSPTIPNAYAELQGGGNISYFYDRRTHVGVTAYGSGIDWLIDGADVDFQPWQRTPYGGTFGAAGADASFGRRWADVFLEVAHSFDSIQPEGGGGPAAILRGTASFDNHEVEVSARYYDETFQNPYARSISQPDQTNGLRVTDEAGGRIRYTGHIADRLDVRSVVDMWHEPSSSRTKFQSSARADVRTFPWLFPGLWLDFQSRDVTARGRERCYTNYTGEEVAAQAIADAIAEGGLPTVPTNTNGSFDGGDPRFDSDDGCSGVQMRVRPRLRVVPHKTINATFQYQHTFVDERRYDDRFRNAARVTAVVRVHPVTPLRLSFRISYSDEDINHNSFLNETVWAYAQVLYRLETWFQPSLRYDIRAWVDGRDSTGFRSANPEHWLNFQLTSRF